MSRTRQVLIGLACLIASALCSAGLLVGINDAAYNLIVWALVVFFGILGVLNVVLGFASGRRGLLLTRDGFTTFIPWRRGQTFRWDNVEDFGIRDISWAQSTVVFNRRDTFQQAPWTQLWRQNTMIGKTVLSNPELLATLRAWQEYYAPDRLADE